MEATKSLSKSRDSELLPSDFFVKNGLRLLNNGQYKEALRVFQKARELSPKWAKSSVEGKIKFHETETLKRLMSQTFDLWLFEVKSSDETFSELEEINGESSDCDLKRKIKQHQNQILYADGIFCQYEGRFNNAVTKYVEALNYCSSDSEKSRIQNLIAISRKQSIFGGSMQSDLEDDILHQVEAILQDCRDALLEKAETTLKFIFKLFRKFCQLFVKSVGFSAAFLNAIITVIDAWKEQRNFERAELLLEFSYAQLAANSEMLQALEEKMLPFDHKKKLLHKEKLTNTNFYQNFNLSLKALVTFFAVILAIVLYLFERT